MLGMVKCNQDIQYLTNSLSLGRNRGESFAKLKKSAYGSLEGWMIKTILFKSNHTTLGKSMIQSILVYAMATFCLPKHFCRSVDKVTRMFWWIGRNDEDGDMILEEETTVLYDNNSKFMGSRLQRRVHGLNQVE